MPNVHFNGRNDRKDGLHQKGPMGRMPLGTRYVKEFDESGQGKMNGECSCPNLNRAATSQNCPVAMKA